MAETSEKDGLGVIFSRLAVQPETLNEKTSAPAATMGHDLTGDSAKRASVVHRQSEFKEEYQSYMPSRGQSIYGSEESRHQDYTQRDYTDLEGVDAGGHRQEQLPPQAHDLGNYAGSESFDQSSMLPRSNKIKNEIRLPAKTDREIISLKTAAQEKVLKKNRDIMQNKLKILKAREDKEKQEVIERHRKRELQRLKDLHHNRKHGHEEEEKDKEGHLILHNISTNNWLRSRHSGKVSSKYYYFPEEISKREQMTAIFQNFDSDGNGQLEIDEFLDMFIETFISSHKEEKEVNIEKSSRSEKEKERSVRRDEQLKTHLPLTSKSRSPSVSPKSSESSIKEDSKDKRIMNRFKLPRAIDDEKMLNEEELQQIRKLLDSEFRKFYTFVTKNNYLSKVEFINVALDKDANEFFLGVMRTLNDMIHGWNKKPEMTIPYSFAKMISYLGYATKRDTLYDKFVKIKGRKFKKAEKYIENLLFLNDKEIMEENETKKKLDAYRMKTKQQVGNFDINKLKSVFHGNNNHFQAGENLDIQSLELPVVTNIVKVSKDVPKSRPSSKIQNMTSTKALTSLGQSQLLSPHHSSTNLLDTQSIVVPEEARQKSNRISLPESKKSQIDLRVKKALIQAKKSGVAESRDIINKCFAGNTFANFKQWGSIKSASVSNMSTAHEWISKRKTQISFYAPQDQAKTHYNATAAISKQVDRVNSKHRDAKSEMPTTREEAQNHQSSYHSPGLGNPTFNWRISTSNKWSISDNNRFASKLGPLKGHKRTDSLARFADTASVKASETERPFVQKIAYQLF